MKSKYIAWLGLSGLAVLLIVAALYVQKRKTDAAYGVFDPAYAEYLSAYTSGEISRRSPVLVQFAYDVIDTSRIGEVLDQSPFAFTPAISGKVRWNDSRTLAFFPDEPLPSGTVFKADLKMRQLLPAIDKKLSTFRFRFGTRHQGARVEITDVKSLSGGSKSYQKVSGQVVTNDFEADDQVEKILRAEFGWSKPVIRWEHKGDDNLHYFVIDSLERGTDSQVLKVKWDGSTAKMSGEGQTEIEVPAKGNFVLLHTRSTSKPEQLVTLDFSEPLDAAQDFSGLVRIGDVPLRISAEGNKIKIFPQKKITGSASLRIEPGIRSSKGDLLNVPLTETLAFTEIAPEVRLIGKGNILPRSSTLPLVFEAVGLKAIDVRVIKIFENNIPQFLQINQLGGNEELRRVGQVVAKKRINLDANASMDLTSWNRHSLDLSSLINADPGAIYEIAIGFRKSYALCQCDEVPEGTEPDMISNDERWHTYNEDGDNYGYGYYYDYYDYEEQEDPCSYSYYTAGKIVKRNILASDLGLIVKSGSTGSVFFVTDIKSTLPISDVALEFYDYQHQLIATHTTGKDGSARATLPRKPYLLIAKSGNQRGYLRLDDGSSLTLSRFDVEGRSYHKGVKGFLYGERGVWRPGDMMYLNFILEDKEKSLPADHPITFELIDSKGQTVEKTVRTQGLNGFYTFHTQTQPDAPTGSYLARVRVGGSTFTQNFRVEAIMPNRLKMEMNFGTAFLSKVNENTVADLKAQWLHGAIAKGFKTDVKVTLRKAETVFPKYKEYTFDDPVRKFSSEEQTLFEGKLSETGSARIPLKITTESEAPGQLTASFVTRVFEPGGAFSTDRFTIPYSPYPVYVGIKAPTPNYRWGWLYTDKDYQIDIATVDANGNPVSSNVDISIYKLGWNWWYDHSGNDIPTYQGKVTLDEAQSASVKTVNGVGKWTLNVPAEKWGRYLVRVIDDQGHASSVIVYLDWPSFVGRSSEREDQGGATMLNFSADKEVYSTGETVTLTIPTGVAGRALISIENGTKVLQTEWIEAKAGTTQYKFKTTAEMSPNAYAFVTLLQPHAQTKNDLPIRLYGVLPFKVEDPASHLSPVIAMRESLEPESRFQVSVSESSGKPMTYTLAVVDEGLLGITRYKTPDPWNAFYQRASIGVKTWDLFDQVLGAYGGEIKSLLSIGGSEDALGPEAKKADRFKPVVIFLGPFELKPGQTMSHDLEMPSYVGAVRAMVVAGRPDGAYGSAEKTAQVKKPLMLLGTLPRVVGPGERISLPVSVFTSDANLKDVSVSITASKHFLPEGPQNQVVKFAQPGEKMTSFTLGALSTLGKAEVKITATSGGQTAVYAADIEVRNPNPRVTNVYAQNLEGGKTWAQTYQLPGMNGTNQGTIEVSAVPPLNLAKRLGYLIRYPYGCIEQTISSVFPQLYLPSLIDLTEKQKVRRDSFIRAGLVRLRAFQNGSGGFTYWPGGQSSEWASNYVGHFLLEAERAGYTLPSGMLDKWKSYNKDVARNWSPDPDTDKWRRQYDVVTQGYRLYLLAQAGSPDIGAMNRLRQIPARYEVSSWYLAGAYYLAGQRDVARTIISGLKTDVPDYTELAGTYGSRYRDLGVILDVLTVMEERGRAGTVLQLISDRFVSAAWMSTQETAYCLAATARFIGRSPEKPQTKFSWRVNGGKWEDVDGNAFFWQTALSPVAGGSIEIKNQGAGLLFPRLVMDGIPLVGDTTEASSGLGLQIVYTGLNGTPLDPGKLEQGTDLMAKVTVSNPSGLRYLEELALTQIFPSGWEILNSRLDETEDGGSKPEYMDVRDDRVNMFFDLNPGESKTFHVRLNAAYPGRYYLPTVTAEAMYDHTINARKKGRWVLVTATGMGG